MNTINDIMKIMEDIEYGFKNTDGVNILDINPDWNFAEYYLQKPDELLKSKCGVCIDQVELERTLFEKNNIPFKTYCVIAHDSDDLPSHTFLVYIENEKYYWFEHSWFNFRGIHEYKSITELLLDVKEKFIKDNNLNDEAWTFIYEYKKPKSHLNINEFYKYIETQKLIKLNKPLYFYHLVNKDVDVSRGLISLKYMYDNKMYDLFDKNALKYKDRITNDWNIEMYKNKENLSREDYISALNLFRGDNGANYIYFFKYPLYKELGSETENLLKYKDIYEININDEELQKLILDIFYGYEMSNSDNKILDKKYYENVTFEEYFSEYDDKLKLKFSKLNHIGISFKDGYCPRKFIRKIN